MRLRNKAFEQSSAEARSRLSLAEWALTQKWWLGNVSARQDRLLAIGLASLSSYVYNVVVCIVRSGLITHHFEVIDKSGSLLSPGRLALSSIRNEMTIGLWSSKVITCIDLDDCSVKWIARIPSAGVQSVQYNNLDDRLFIIVDKDSGSSQIIEAATGQLIRSLGRTKIDSSVSPVNGDFAYVLAKPRPTVVWSEKDGTRRLIIEKSEVNSVLLTHNDLLIVCDRHDGLVAYDAAGACIWSCPQVPWTAEMASCGMRHLIVRGQLHPEKPLAEYSVLDSRSGEVLESAWLTSSSVIVGKNGVVVDTDTAEKYVFRSVASD